VGSGRPLEDCIEAHNWLMRKSKPKKDSEKIDLTRESRAPRSSSGMIAWCRH
jgi:hypothetical protein